MNMLLAQSASLDVATSEGLGIIAKFLYIIAVIVIAHGGWQVRSGNADMGKMSIVGGLLLGLAVVIADACSKRAGCRPLRSQDGQAGHQHPCRRRQRRQVVGYRGNQHSLHSAEDADYEGVRAKFSASLGNTQRAGTAPRSSLPRRRPASPVEVFLVALRGDKLERSKQRTRPSRP
jgi:hypothetical protein